MERTRRTTTDTGWRPRKFVKVYDGLTEAFGTEKALILSVLISRYDEVKHYGKLQHGSFYMLRSEIERLTGYTAKTVTKYLNEMRDEMIIVTGMRGKPPKQWFSFNWGVIQDCLNRRKSTANCNRRKSTAIKDCHEITTDPHIMEDSQETLNRRKNTANNNRTIEKNYSSEDEDDNLYSSDKKIMPSNFDTFWNLYPRHLAYGKAKSVWDELCTEDDRPTLREIKLAINAQRRSPQWQKKNFIPFPTTWLKEKRWRDNAEDMQGHIEVKDANKEARIMSAGEWWNLHDDGFYYNDEGRRLPD